MGTNQNIYSTTGEEYIDESLSYNFPTSEISRSFSRRRRDYKGCHLRKSLKPKRGLKLKLVEILAIRIK
jgi:hypothetical protein